MQCEPWFRNDDIETMHFLWTGVKQSASHLNSVEEKEEKKQTIATFFKYALSPLKHLKSFKEMFVLYL